VLSITYVGTAIVLSVGVLALNVSAWRDQRSRASLGGAHHRAGGTALKKPTAAGFAIAAIMLAVPTANAKATLTVEPVAACYREQSTVRLPGSGFTPNAMVVFSRDGTPIGDPLQADGSGGVYADLILPGLVSGQRRLTYVATDPANLTSQVSLLVTATDVTLRPRGGPPNRLLTIRARGFIVPDRTTLYAHVIRTGKRGAKARNMRIGRVTGPCRQLTARKRLFARGTAPGKYRIQFDTFRRYQAKRTVKTEFIVTVFQTAGAARASGLSPAS
jgi:hypothetical protein